MASWESCEAQTTADHAKHKGSSYICQKNVLMISSTFVSESLFYVFLYTSSFIWKGSSSQCFCQFYFSSLFFFTPLVD